MGYAFLPFCLARSGISKVYVKGKQSQLMVQWPPKQPNDQPLIYVWKMCKDCCQNAKYVIY